MNTGICPDCFKVVRLTKQNKCFRHGYRSNASNKNWRGEFLGLGFGMNETRPACGGSGKAPRTESRLTQLAADKAYMHATKSENLAEGLLLAEFKSKKRLAAKA